MKKVYSINKSRLYGGDYSAVISNCVVNGYKLERINLEETEIDDGSVCFFDPYNIYDAESFNLVFPVGNCKPFALTVSTSKGRRIAFAGLDFGDITSATEWRLALRDKKEVIKLSVSDSAGGTAIGSGFGAICSESVMLGFSALVKYGGNAYHPLDGAVSMDGNCFRVCEIKNIRLPVFSTGWGEGNYRCYAGIDSSGKIKGVICDFAVVKSPIRKDNGETIELELQVAPDDLFVPNPDKSDAENSIDRNTTIIENENSDNRSLFDAYSRRGYAYHISSRFDEALADYLKALDIMRPDSGFASHAWPLYDNAALIYRERGDYERAIKLYNEAKKISDNFYGGAYEGLIEIYREKKDFDAALSVANEMVADRPHNPSAYYRRSSLYMQREDYERAVADLDVLISEFKMNESILDKALCLFYLDRKTEALETLDSYLIEGRANETFYDIRAAIEFANGDFFAAYNDSLKSHEVNPKYTPALERLIELDGLLMNFKKTAKWATRYIEVCRKSEYGYGIRAAAYARIGEYENAIDDYEYLAVSSGNPRYCALTVKTALLSGDKRLAKKYRNMLRKTDRAYYVYAAGLFLFAARKYDKAESYFAFAFTLKEDEIILSALLDCFLETKQYRKAENTLKTFAEISEPEYALCKKAYCCKRLGQPTLPIWKEYVKKFIGNNFPKDMLRKAETYFESPDNFF